MSAEAEDGIGTRPEGGDEKTGKRKSPREGAKGRESVMLKRALISFSREIITNEVLYSDGLRSWVAVCLADGCKPSLPDCYIDDAVQRARIAALFLDMAGRRTSMPLYIDECACKLNPWYRHSQQRRDNLAALRPPGLTGKPAELYDAAQRDAAQEAHRELQAK